MKGWEKKEKNTEQRVHGIRGKNTLWIPRLPSFLPHLSLVNWSKALSASSVRPSLSSFRSGTSKVRPYLGPYIVVIYARSRKIRAAFKGKRKKKKKKFITFSSTAERGGRNWIAGLGKRDFKSIFCQFCPMWKGKYRIPTLLAWLPRSWNHPWRPRTTWAAFRDW